MTNDHSLDLPKAHEIWHEYQRTHDNSAYARCSVVVDVNTAELFFGESGLSVARLLKPADRFRSLVVVRMKGADHRHLRWSRGRLRRITDEEIATPIIVTASS